MAKSQPLFCRWQDRDAVQHALGAFLALSLEQREEMVQQYNAFQSLRAHPNKLTHETSPKESR